MLDVLQAIADKSKSFEDADFLSNIFGKYRNQIVSKTIPVVLFGAGSAGKELLPILNKHGVTPVCFCDNNLARSGEIFCGLPVIPPSDLRQHYRDSLIFITVGAHRDAIQNQLAGIGFDEDRILSISNQEALIYYTHLDQWRWPEEDLHSRADELQKVYELLSDQKSRDIFVARISMFARGADYQSFRSFISELSEVVPLQGSSFDENRGLTNYERESYLQFNNDLITLSGNEILVDGGAYTGDSTISFITACKESRKSYRKIFCYEPDPRIFAELQKNVAPYPNIIFRPFGLWSHAAANRFADSSILKPGSARIVSVYHDNKEISGKESGFIEIQTISLDMDIPEEKVTIIKMDIEGSEIQALQGAMNTITRCRPKLIISAYHKRDDLFEIPLLIHKMVPEYKMYFRHFSGSFSETTLFAIP